MPNVPEQIRFRYFVRISPQPSLQTKYPSTCDERYLNLGSQPVHCAPTGSSLLNKMLTSKCSHQILTRYNSFPGFLINTVCQYCYRVIMTYLMSPIGNPSPSTHSKLNSIVRFHGSEPAFQTGTNFSYPSFSSLIFQEFESVMWSGEIAFETAKIWFSPSLVITHDFWKSFTLSGEPWTKMRTILLAKQTESYETISWASLW